MSVFHLVFAMRIVIFSKLLGSKEMLGISFMLISRFFMAFSNCLTKVVVLSIDPMNMAFYRNVLALITIAPFAYYYNRQLLSRNPLTKVNIARGVGGFLGTVLFFLSIAELPVSEVTALTSITPLFVCLLAVIFLKEKMTIEKLIALFAGLLGIYIIFKPQGTVNIAIGYILAACLVWASTNILTKNLTKTQDSFTIVFDAALLAVPLSLPWAIYNPYIPTMKEIFSLSLNGILITAAQLFMTKAYSVTRVTVVTPFDFTRLIFVGIISYFMLDEAITQRNIIGGLIIAIAGYVVVLKELKNKNQSKVS